MSFFQYWILAVCIVFALLVSAAIALELRDAFKRPSRWRWYSIVKKLTVLVLLAVLASTTL